MKSKAILVMIVIASILGSSAIASKKETKSSAPSAQASLSGVVTDKYSNEKLAGVLIELTDTDQKIYSNSKGEFSIEGIAPGTYKVKINCISYKDKEVTITVAKSQKEKLKVVLNPIEP